MARVRWLLFPCLFLGACASTPPLQEISMADTSSVLLGSRKAPYERHHRWKDWSVQVRTLPNQNGPISWYEVSIARIVKDEEKLLQRNVHDAEGAIQATWLEDVKGTGWPVLILFMNDGGKGRYGFLRMLECDATGSRVMENPPTPRSLLAGYRGGDVWSWDEGNLTRKFSLYREGDEPGQPTGGARFIRYTWEGGRWRQRYKDEAPPETEGTSDGSSAP